MEDSSGKTKCSHNKLHRKQVGRWDTGAEDVETEAERNAEERTDGPLLTLNIDEQTETWC